MDIPFSSACEKPDASSSATRSVGRYLGPLFETKVAAIASLHHATRNGFFGWDFLGLTAKFADGSYYRGRYAIHFDYDGRDPARVEWTCTNTGSKVFKLAAGDKPTVAAAGLPLMPGPALPVPAAPFAPAPVPARPMVAVRPVAASPFTTPPD